MQEHIIKEREMMQKYITDDMKKIILSSIEEEFCIDIETKDNNNVCFRKDGLKFHADVGLWEGYPIFDNILYICDKMGVVWDRSQTQKLIFDFVENFQDKYYSSEDSSSDEY